jgi:hypothetical protein
VPSPDGICLLEQYVKHLWSFRKIFFLASIFIGICGLSAFNLTSIKSLLSQWQFPGRKTAKTARPQANGGSPQPTLAPFYGNLTAIEAPAGSTFSLTRLSDCSLGYGSFLIPSPGMSEDVTVNAKIPNYERVLHEGAFLTTTADEFPNGCAAKTQGATSGPAVFLGRSSDNSMALGASVSVNALFTYGVTTSYDVTVRMMAPDIVPASVTGGDLNKDGNTDLVSINTDGVNSSVSVFISNGDGTYKPAVNYELPNVVAQFGVVDDLNQDGNLDVVVGAGFGQAFQFMIYLGKGDGTLAAPVAYTPGQANLSFATPFITADVNSDGIPDIITSLGQVFLGQKSGTMFTLAPQTLPAVLTATNQFAPGMVALDFNNDGKVDLATDDGLTIRTYVGNGNGTFSTGPAYAAIANRGLIVGTDLDGDGNVDLYSGIGGNAGYGADDFETSTGYALLGNGDGTFAGAPSLPVRYSGMNVVDLNGDGRPDVVGVDTVGGVVGFTTYLTQASGIPVAGPQLALAAGVSVDSFAVAPLTTGANPALVFVSAAPQAQSFYVAMGKGDGSFGAPTATPVPSLVPVGNDINEVITGVQLADINHDGKADLIYSFSDQDSVSQTYYQGFAVQLGNGDGTFGAPKITTTYVSANPPQIFFSNQLSAVVDVNKDNFPDVFVILPNGIVNGTAQNAINLFLGKGDGTFGTGSVLTLTGNIEPQSSDTNLGSPFAFADLNGDGNIDIVASGSSSDGTTPTFAVALGNGDGTFKPPTLFTVEGFGYAGSPAIADFTGDGKMDLALPGATEGSGGIFPGNGDGTFQSIANGDGTISPTETIALAVSGGAVAADFNNDGKMDLMFGSVILLNKEGATPPVLATTSTAIASSLNPSTSGANVTFTATVTSATAGTITGTVTFLDGATTIGTGTLAAGTATFSTSSLAVGPHTITAQYGGDANFATSTSPAVTQTVNSASKATTATAVASSLNPSTSGTSVTFTATVTSSTAGTITGTVTFLDGATSIGTGTLAAGVATFSTSSLAVGPHTITAQYGGDANFAASTSPAITQTVNAAQTGDFSVAANPASLTIVAGQTGSVALSVTPLNGSKQTVTFACSGLPAASACSFVPPSVTLDGTHTAATQVTITTTARNGDARAAGASGSLPGAGRMLGTIALGFAGIFGLSFLRARNRVWRVALVLAVLAVPAMALMSCSGSPTGSGGGTPAGTSTIMLSGTSGTDAHAASVTLTVN